MLNSLRGRLLILTTILLCALMLLIGWLSTKLYHGSQMNHMRDQLRLHSHSILAAADYQTDGIRLPEYLAEDLFNQADSGLYAQLVNEYEQKVWSSRSAKKLSRLGLDWAPVGQWRYNSASRTVEGEVQRLFVASYGVQWVNAKTAGETPHWNLILIADMNPIFNRAEVFKKQMWIVLFVLSFILLIAQLVVLKWGLKPLQQITSDLEALQQGKQTSLEGTYPKELRPLTSNLNRLISTERNQRERYRNTLADLSHSLKTPLTVVSGIIHHDVISYEDKSELSSQIDRMSKTIQYQLQRSMMGGQSMAMQKLEVSPVIRSVVNALGKVYSGRDIFISTELDNKCHFHGDENDLIEIVGNLVDNACKYGAGRVGVQTRSWDDSWHLIVEDNGSGIESEMLDSILARGVRLDSMEIEAQTGQGLGLALVKDIIEAINAELTVCKSEMGGCCFKVVFPHFVVE